MTHDDLPRRIAWMEGFIAASQLIMRWLRAIGHDELATRIMMDEPQELEWRRKQRSSDDT